MTILHTTNYGLAYCDDMTAIADLATVTQEIAETLDEQLGLTGFTPPDATSFAELAARVTAVETDVDALQDLTAADYQGVTFSNGFAQFTVAPYGEKIRAVKTSLGEVRFSGHLSVPIRSVTTSVLAMNLPVGYRPAVQLVRYLDLNGATGSAPDRWRVNIETNGNVQVLPAATTSAVGFGQFDWTFRTTESI